MDSDSTSIAQAETYQSDEPFDHALHGTSGPIKVSFANDHLNVAADFLAVVAEYDKERGFTEDANDFSTCNAYGVSSSALEVLDLITYSSDCQGRTLVEFLRLYFV
jgi:hypothetical protein